MSVPPLAKYLASTEKKTRDKAIKNLSIFLSDTSQDAMSKPDLSKLWKGIFYCFWMSDKPLIQQALANELAELVLTITTTPASLIFLRGFWETTVREWNGIDRLRIDKYYMLVRRFVNASFRLLIRSGWDKTSCDEYNDILTGAGGPLCPSDIRVPTSLAYHLADIYLEELDKALIKAQATAEAIPPAPLKSLISPFVELAAGTPTNTTFLRIQSALLQPLIAALTTVSPPLDSEPSLPAQKRARIDTETPSTESYTCLVSNACFEYAEEPSEGLVLRRKVLRYLFEVASNPDTRDSNRRKLYALWKTHGDEDDDE